MPSFKPTIVNEPPPKRTGTARRTSRYAPLLDLALEHENQWLRAGLKVDAKRADGIARSVSSAGRTLARRTGLAGTFEVAARVDANGVPDVYLRYARRNGGHA